MNETEQDVYIRDHLLIQFMLNRYAPISFSERGKRFVENVYQDWVNWLEQQEASHASE